MVVFGVVARIRQKDVGVKVRCRLSQGRSELGGVVARASGDDGGRYEVAPDMAYDRDLGPEVVSRSPRARTARVVRTDVVRFKPRGVDRSLGPLLDQAESSSACEDGGEKAIERPPFRIRRSA